MTDYKNIKKISTAPTYTRQEKIRIVVESATYMAMIALVVIISGLFALMMTTDAPVLSNNKSIEGGR
ncbi:MAG: hypothetical protein A2X80_07905 [Geobacteraceae bacterium GWB2_52_12]|nr:MAG: hypothetical protein A2X80_07905 [Geobacteraceae bacterium GWB2_52_12]